MSYCSKCGKEVAENSSFCVNCGENLKKEQATIVKNSVTDSKKYLNPWMAILITIGILLFMIVGIEVVGPFFPFLVVVGSAIWVAVETSKLELNKYKSGNSPIVMFAGCCLLWIVVFPWFLVMQSKVKNGLAQLKNNV
jgi:hypothetical protein